MNRHHEIDKIPGLKDLLRRCQEDIEKLTNTPVTVFYRIKFHHLSTNDLIRIICDVCEVTWQQVTSDSRKAHYVIARQLYCYIAFTVQKKQLVAIAKILGRDHTSIIHSRDKVINMKATNDELYMVPLLEIEKRIEELMISSLNSIQPIPAAS